MEGGGESGREGGRVGGSTIESNNSPVHLCPSLLSS